MNKWIVIGGAGLAVLIVGYWMVSKAQAADLPKRIKSAQADRSYLAYTPTREGVYRLARSRR